MTPETATALHRHALVDYPREACGLVVVARGKELYLPCVNAAATPDENFIIPNSEYKRAEQVGEIVAVVHSHPGVPARPSEADLVGCEASDLPWIIVSVMVGAGTEPAIAETVRIEPRGYEAPLIGRTFHHGVLDCWALCRDWYKREWGLDLPDPERRDGWWDDGHSDLYTEHLDVAGFDPIERQDIRVGDMILMQIRSRNRVPNHAAIYLGRGMMLHHLCRRLSSRDLYGGYWQEKTSLIVRHRLAPCLV